MNFRQFILILMFLVVVSCNKKNDFLLVNLSSQDSGLNFSNTLQNTADLNILNYLYYYNGAGVLAGDFNNDDLIDLFFTGNEVPDELFINKGSLSFQKTTQISGINPSGNWSTGATYVDINNDGLLDIYICKASGYRKLEGKNQLFVNQGVNPQGIPTFNEEAQKYGLDFDGLSTQAAFFDFDLDGDLDMFLLNHSVHPNRNYGNGNLRATYNVLSGDVLYENQNGLYVDVSSQSGIFQGRIGYGLGLSISDVNNDGYPDIYIGNDFFENDYLYINQTDGTFKEVISNDEHKLGHTTHFSMGNCLSDFNNDGLVDIVSLDMLPEDLNTYKTSGLEYEYPIYRQYLKKGYAPQYMQNTLHYNLDGNRFAEIGNLSGIAATEWSWGVLDGDLNNDGYKDLFITNGIVGATNDMDYMNFIANEDIQKRIDAGMTNADLPLIKEIPEKKVSNYIFQNEGNLSFTNVSKSWANIDPTFSNGTIYADLDNDGDLDIVTNNINESATILENTAKETNWLQLKFEGPKNNPFGIGTKVQIKSTQNQVQENFPVKGYLSTVAPQLHFGLGKDTIVNALTVQWPDGKTQTLSNINSNKKLSLNYKNASYHSSSAPLSDEKRLKVVDTIIPFFHKENISVDFDREPLIPFASSNEGPCISVADINKDGLDDIFIGGGKRQSSELFLQSPDGTFNSIQGELFETSALREATCSIFFDANNDGWQDLVVGYAGNEFKSGVNIQPELYINANGTLSKKVNAFEDSTAINLSAIEIGDLNNDGYIDLILAAGQSPANFGKTAKSHVLLNNGEGVFNDVTRDFAPDFEYLGNLSAIKCVDFNSDGKKDLIAIGQWIPISIFINDGKRLQLQNNTGLENSHGWWKAIEIGDFDEDGDIDLVCGNWGLNTKFKASIKEPITLYRNDFDDNGTVEPLVTYFHKETETPFASKDALVKQIPQLNKEFLSYKKFAAATLTQLFGRDKLEDSEIKKVFDLETSYFQNNGELKFEKQPLPKFVQASEIRNIISSDLNEDGHLDLVLMGNNHHISTQLGRLDALHGLVLYNDGNGGFMKNMKHLSVDGQVNSIKKITIKNKKGFIIGRNADSPIFLSKNDSL